MSSTTTQPTHHKLNPWLRLVQAAVLLVWSRRRYWNPWLLLVPVIILILIPGAERFQGSNLVEGFGNWAWDRHHNMLSWAVRPLLIMPFLYFAYCRNWQGVMVALVLIATNFFWFPMPANPDSSALEFLSAERQWIESSWDISKVLLVSSIPAGLFLLGLAFWKRSLLIGLLLIDGIFVLKSVYSVELDKSGWALIPFLIVALVIFNAVVLYIVRLIRNRLQNHPASTMAAQH
ncbi:MAG: hypothetical protein H7175_06460 [Burkholderiales bacterium]|nr:hypothetical protein [Anaerolineae bacterium]